MHSTLALAAYLLAFTASALATPAKPASNQTQIDAFWRQGSVTNGDVSAQANAIYGRIFSNRYDKTTGRCATNGPSNLFNIGQNTCTNIPGTNCMEVDSYTYIQHMIVCNKSGCGGICNPLQNLDVHVKTVNGSALYIVDTPGTNSVDNFQ